MAEIIIIAIFASAAMLAAILAVHNIQELSDTRIKYDISQKEHSKLLAQNALLEQENDSLVIENEKLVQTLSAINEENRELFSELEKARETGKSPDTSGTSQRENEQYERLPENIATNRYDCEGYAFPVNTDQAILQEECYTDPETGIRYYRDYDGNIYYCAAMGTAYGIDIGRCFEVTLECGTKFGVILSDYQHPITIIDPDDFGEIYLRDDEGNIIDRLRNADGELVVHVLEFVTDMNVVPKAAIEAGGMHGLEKFGGRHGTGGNIVKIEHLGRKWKP